MTVTGSCKLCQSRDVALRDSHLLPKGGYRLLTRSEGGNAPVIMNSQIAFSKDEQVRGHVLCGDCETRLNANGEGWMLSQCYRVREGFALKNALELAVPVYADGSNLRVYSAATVAEIDVPKLVYFAASVFWRASVHAGSPEDAPSTCRHSV
jgi:hypothetical protein